MSTKELEIKPNKMGLYTPEQVAQMFADQNGRGPSARTIREMRRKIGGAIVIAKRIYFTKDHVRKLIAACSEQVSDQPHLV